MASRTLAEKRHESIHYAQHLQYRGTAINLVGQYLSDKTEAICDATIAVVTMLWVEDVCHTYAKAQPDLYWSL